MVEKSKFASFDEEFEDETAAAEAGGKKEDQGDGDEGDEGSGKEGDGDSGENGEEKSEEGDGSGSGEGDSDNGGSGGDGKNGKDEGGSGEGDKAGKGGEDKKEKEIEGESSKDEGGDGDGSASKDESGKGDGTEGDGEKASGEGGKRKEGEEEGDADIFSDAISGEGEGADTKGAITYKPIAKEFDIELENDTQEEFAAKVKEKIESSKQELNLVDYSDQARSLIKHLNDNKGDVGEFLTNPVINEMQGILNMEPEDKVRMVRINEMVKEGLTGDQAIEKYNEELNNASVADIRKMSDTIDSQAKTLRDEEIVKITGSREEKLKAERITEDNRIIQEQKQVREFIQTQEDFLGIKLTAKAKAQIISDLDTGRFDTIVEKNPAASRFFSYMTARYGPRIIENFSKSKSETSRDGYNNATEKHADALHNSKSEAAGKQSSGHAKGEEGTKKNFDTWQDKDLYGDDENE